MDNKNYSTVDAVANELYEASVAGRALSRAGRCIQLKGNVFEIMYCDKYNANPSNLINGRTAHLTKSTTAEMKDVVIMKNGKVVGHAQLKDCTSPEGLRKTLKQIESGHYNKTKIYGTSETAEALKGKTNQPVHDSSISSKDTKRVADKALGKMPTISDLGYAAKSSFKSGALVSGGIEAACSGYKVFTGEKGIKEATKDVGSAAITGGLSSATASTASGLAAGLTGTALTTAASSVALPAVLVTAAPVVAGLGVGLVVAKVTSDVASDIVPDTVEFAVDLASDVISDMGDLASDFVDTFSPFNWF